MWNETSNRKHVHWTFSIFIKQNTVKIVIYSSCCKLDSIFFRFCFCVCEYEMRWLVQLISGLKLNTIRLHCWEMKSCAFWWPQKIKISYNVTPFQMISLMKTSLLSLHSVCRYAHLNIHGWCWLMLYITA